MEEEHPARGDERGRHERGHSPGDPRPERSDQRHARHREERGEHPQRLQPAAHVHDEPGEEEMKRRPAALALHGLEQVRKGLAPDEESQRLVLVRRPRREPRKQEAGDGHGAGRDPEREPALGDPDADRLRAGCCLSRQSGEILGRC